jgi:hypothetical protein
MQVEVLDLSGEVMSFELRAQDKLTLAHLAREALREVRDNYMLEPSVRVGEIHNMPTSSVLAACDKLLTDAKESVSERDTA